MENGGKRGNWTTWLRHCLVLPWAEMILAVFCFHFALGMASVVARVVLVILGLILLAKAIADIVSWRACQSAD
jgi:hypothetical protein